jgi:hypothetical protein
MEKDVAVWGVVTGVTLGQEDPQTPNNSEDITQGDVVRGTGDSSTV